MNSQSGGGSAHDDHGDAFALPDAIPPEGDDDFDPQLTLPALSRRADDSGSIPAWDRIDDLHDLTSPDSTGQPGGFIAAPWKSAPDQPGTPLPPSSPPPAPRRSPDVRRTRQAAPPEHRHAAPAGAPPPLDLSRVTNLSPAPAPSIAPYAPDAPTGPGPGEAASSSGAPVALGDDVIVGGGAALTAARRVLPPGEEPAREVLGGEVVATDAQLARRRRKERNDRHWRKRRLRSMTATIAVLMLLVPILGWTGFRYLATSKNGTVLTRNHGPADPGYRALVTTTPTMLVAQHNAVGALTSLTLLSLSGASEHGGALVQIPVDTLLATPEPGLRSLAEAYASGRMPRLRQAVASVLGIGIDEVIDLDPSRLSALVAPVAPVPFRNPIEVTLPGGRTLPEGDTQLTSDEFAQYMATTAPGETDLARITRNVSLWKAWFAAVAGSSDPASVPGEATAGIGRFVRGLAAGAVTDQTLPLLPSTDAGIRADPTLVALMISEVVPYPVAATPGQRVLVRVLSSRPGTPVASSVLQRLVFGGAQIAELGNADQTGGLATVVQYVDPGMADEAKRLLALLGLGQTRLVPDRGDAVGITITVGSDLLDRPPGPLTAADVGR